MLKTDAHTFVFANKRISQVVQPLSEVNNNIVDYRHK